MVQGVNKEFIFYKEEYIKKYISIIKENMIGHNFTLLAFCIMNNHAHFLIYTEDIEDFGSFMKRVNQLYAQMYNREENRCGVLFRNRYQIQPIYDENYLIKCIKYIHNNPVKANMVSKCEDYPYSSYKDYINNSGVTKSEIMRKIYGDKCNYIELFGETYEALFMDTDKKTQKIKKNI